MRSLKPDYFDAPVFSHIYIEKEILSHPRTRQLLERFPGIPRIEIDHYKDVFCRQKQDYGLQQRSRKLILAGRREHFLYEGAPVCQDFGNRHFYYSSCVMNCIYDCEYCYLKGMYPSGHLVVFVNLEDYFRAVAQKLREHPVYLCVSYDSDLAALEKLLGTCELWTEFAAKHPDLTIEIRTKSANGAMWDRQEPLPNIVYAFTLSPQRIVEQSEHQTPSAQARVSCAVEGMAKGFPVRLCFDPMLYCADWQQEYGSLLQQIDRELEERQMTWEQVRDVSVGTFRISKEYMRILRAKEPDSLVTQFPYENVDGVYQYPPKLKQQMEQWMIEELSGRISKECIYHEYRTWNTEEGGSRYGGELRYRTCDQ